MARKKDASKSTRFNGTAQEGTKLLIKELQTARAVEVVAIISLNGKLAEKLERLVDTAFEQACRKKNHDTRLLRLIVRYASSTTRRMPGLNSPNSFDEVTQEELRTVK